MAMLKSSRFKGSAKAGGFGHRVLSTTDAWVTLGVPALYALAWSVPSGNWPRASGALVSCTRGFLQDNDSESPTRRMRAAVVAHASGCDPEAVRREFIALHVERLLPYFRSHPRTGWRPSVRLTGREHLEAALARGKGAIVWDSHFAFASLATKVALAEAGRPMTHLSHPRHGFSDTRYGQGVLNPIIYGVECRYLVDRVVLDPEDAAPALARLRQALEANGVVSITVRTESNRPILVPFLGTTGSLAAGAPYLAHQTGAALLPTHTVRQAHGALATTIEAPLEVDPEAPRAAAIEQAGHDYFARLQPWALAYPGQWFS